MQPPIKLNWWRGQSGKLWNLGDELNRFIVEFVSGRKVEKSSMKDADLLAIGSVLWFPHKNGILAERSSPLHIWGSGAMSAASIGDPNKFRFSALRGPLTHSLIGFKEGITYGDPGILASAVWEGATEPTHAWGLIPHHSHLDRPWVQKFLENTPNSILIDVRDKDIAGSIKKISSCEMIASTSLHGLVLADSYKIPNVWLWDGALHPGATYKFLDYFSGIERRTSDFVHCNNIANLDEINPAMMDIWHFGSIDSKARALAKCFPL